MFNREPLNRGKFNVPNVGSKNASSHITIKTNIITVFKQVFGEGLSFIKISTTAIPTKKKWFSGTSAIKLKTTSNRTLIKYGLPIQSSFFLKSVGDATLENEQLFVLENLNLYPGQELIINSCDMTAIMSGTNVLSKMAYNSDFISLLSGSNSIIYSDDEVQRNVSIEVLWKDRYL